MLNLFGNKWGNKRRFLEYTLYAHICVQVANKPQLGDK